MSATSSAGAQLNTSKNFSSSATLASSTNSANASATDGGNNTVTNTYQVSTNNAPSPTLTYDANGNMTNDGTNTYQWDGENRLIQVNYSGGGNSQFTYDGLNRCTKIVESTGSTKQLVWSSDLICEARDGSGNLLSQYFEFGQVNSGTTSFSTHDHFCLFLNSPTVAEISKHSMATSR